MMPDKDFEIYPKLPRFASNFGQTQSRLHADFKNVLQSRKNAGVINVNPKVEDGLGTTPCKYFYNVHQKYPLPQC